MPEQLLSPPCKPPPLRTLTIPQSLECSSASDLRHPMKPSQILPSLLTTQHLVFRAPPSTLGGSGFHSVYRTRTQVVTHPQVIRCAVKSKTAHIIKCHGPVKAQENLQNSNVFFHFLRFQFSQSGWNWAMRCFSPENFPGDSNVQAEFENDQRLLSHFPQILRTYVCPGCHTACLKARHLLFPWARVLGIWHQKLASPPPFLFWLESPRLVS